MDTARIIGFVLWAVLLVGGYSLSWYLDSKKKKRLKEEIKRKERDDGEGKKEEEDNSSEC